MTDDSGVSTPFSADSGYDDGEATSATNLFIANLPETAKDDDLRGMFSTFGNIVSCKVMIDFNTGKSRGFGFVKFESASQGTHRSFRWDFFPGFCWV
jgi:RNA recognition motif-containing protein